MIAQLFEEEKDSVQIIKWKEIFEVIETTVDKCEDVSSVIEIVNLKNAPGRVYLVDVSSQSNN